LIKFNGFAKSDFDVFIKKDWNEINAINSKLENMIKLLYKRYPDLNKTLPNKIIGKPQINTQEIDYVGAFLWKLGEKHYSVPHYTMGLTLNWFGIHVCFEAKDISRKFIKTLKNNENKRAEFLDILEMKEARGFIIEINKRDFIMPGNRKNRYNPVAYIWLDKEWIDEDIVKFIYKQMDKINNLLPREFQTKKAHFYLHKHIYRDDPILTKTEFIDEVYKVIQTLRPMYDFLLKIA